jgi:hypothetical protein
MLGVGLASAAGAGNTRNVGATASGARTERSLTPSLSVPRRLRCVDSRSRGSRRQAPGPRELGGGPPSQGRRAGVRAVALRGRAPRPEGASHGCEWMTAWLGRYSSRTLTAIRVLITGRARGALGLAGRGRALGVGRSRRLRRIASDGVERGRRLVQGRGPLRTARRAPACALEPRGREGRAAHRGPRRGVRRGRAACSARRA